MKSWLLMCVLLSAAIVGVQIHKMRWLATTYHVAPDGHLKNPGSSARVIVDWSSLGGFESMQGRFLPGDELELEHVRSKLPLLKNLKGESLTIVRDRRPVAYFRRGVIEFYGVSVLFAALPFVIWAVATVVSSRGGRPAP